MLTEKQIENIVEAKVAMLATAGKNGKPRCVALMPSRVEKDRIVVCNIQMKQTIENLKENEQCFLNVFVPDKEDLQYKIEGVAEILSAGELFDEIKNYEENENGLLECGLHVNDVIVIHVKNVEESNG